MSLVKNPATGRYIRKGGKTYLALKAQGVRFGRSTSKKRKTSTSPKKRKTSTSPKKRKTSTSPKKRKTSTSPKKRKTSTSPKKRKTSTSEKRKTSTSPKKAKTQTKYRHPASHSKKEQTIMGHCGPQCFLIPSSMKYPVCKPDCSVDCRRLKKGARRLKKAGYKNIGERMKAVGMAGKCK
jgi:DNA mismatch repair ATPase MutL